VQRLRIATSEISPSTKIARTAGRAPDIGHAGDVGQQVQFVSVSESSPRLGAQPGSGGGQLRAQRDLARARADAAGDQVHPVGDDLDRAAAGDAITALSVKVKSLFPPSAPASSVTEP